MRNIHVIIATLQEAKIFKGLPLSISISGVGRENAYKKAQAVISRGASFLISSGTATALSPYLRPGNIIMPKMILSSSGETLYVARHRDIVQRLRIHERNPVFFGPLLETNYVLTDLRDKRRLYNETNCIAADMESATILKAAYEAKVQFICIRSISDSHDMRMPQWLLNCLKENGMIPFGLLIKGILFHLSDLYDFIRLVNGFYKARNSLRAVIGRICSSLPF